MKPTADQKPLLRSSSERARFGRFLAVGIINTLASYLVYLGLLILTGYAVAYTASYIAGIALSYALNSKLVFDSPMSLESAVKFPLVYLFQYAAGLGIVSAQVEWLSIPAWIAPWVATAILVPVSFLLTRVILLRK